MSQDYLQQLNTVQRQAVTATEGPVLVVAGPGSGKTRVLTYRIAHLIQNGVPPYQVLALTFTNKAAREMKERIARVVGGKANQVWAGTFHSIFARILRVEADKIGYPSNFTIYDADDSKSLITSIIKEMNLDTNTYSPNAIRARISSAKSNLITPPLYEKDDKLKEEDRMAKRPYIYMIYKRYTARCKKAGAMDFDDLLYRLYELLQKNPDGVLEKYQKKFKYVMVDEFQDTNQLQYAIVRKLVNYQGSPRNVCVVGDDAQSIYAFRGATIKNILDFETDFKPHGIQVFKLEQNYRSTDHIVSAANEVITRNKRQIPKTIISEKGEGQRIRVIRAVSDEEEGKRVADTIVEQKNRFHLSNSDIAILYRTNSQSRIFEEYLRRYNLNYKVFGGLSFYQRKEVKDLVAYLRLAVNINDEEALRRVINFPKRGIGASTVDKIRALANSSGRTMWECLPLVKVATKTGNSLRAFVEIIKNFREIAAHENAYEAAIHIAGKSGILNHYKADNSQEGVNRTDNITALLDGVKSFVDEDTVIDTENIPDKSLASYIQNIALLTDLDSEETQNDYISLMSVHSAKGLEFKSVFLVGMEEKLFPSFMSMDSIEEIDEERRLFYVAITRAEEYLNLSYANMRYRFGKPVYNEPSRFLDELPGNALETIMSARNQPTTSSFSESRSRAGVQGAFKKAHRQPTIDPSSFNPSPSSEIEAGMRVLHLKFGEGKVLKIDGGQNNRIATIAFDDIDNPERRIMLKYAKLQIL